MSGRGVVSRSIEASETIRKAREIAWVLCLVSPFAFGAYMLRFVDSHQTTGSKFNQDLEKLLIYGLLFVFLLAFLRLLVVAVRLGRDLGDSEFIQRQRPSRFAVTYLLKRYLGLPTNVR